ncbi:hypothetical protein ANACOL_01781 [Anaerotruncus colihominis DSM 17241]|uniref:Uncharacterized protein n=1 Tax=Anaerotruncus colihominis DSM 17241 TaxID=445972 RepID=B0PAI3_9FIRM|nr:hypothetical protein ANACOL_01781 [Anaerotruncus colihominis DSM 17241]
MRGIRTDAETISERKRPRRPQSGSAAALCKRDKKRKYALRYQRESRLIRRFLNFNNEIRNST